MSIPPRRAAAALLFAAALAVCALLAACAPQSSQPQSDKPDEPVQNQQGPSDDNGGTIEAAWTTNSDCGACHLANQIPQDGAHGAHAALTCISCHTDDEKLATVHDEATAVEQVTVKRLKKTEVAREACLSCHEGDYTPEATSGTTVLTDSTGLTVNPHELPDGEQHAEIACADCHGMHGDESVEEKAPETCLSCHHQNEYTCHTCHE